MACRVCEVWDEQQCPWLNVAVIQLTTFIPCRALRRTCFNVTAKPSCLRFPAAKSASDPHSYQQAWSTIYSELEMRHLSQMMDDEVDCGDGPVAACSTRRLSRLPMQHIVSVCTAPIKDGGTVPRVDVFITFTGEYGRLVRLDYQRSSTSTTPTILTLILTLVCRVLVSDVPQ